MVILKLNRELAGSLFAGAVPEREQARTPPRAAYSSKFAGFRQLRAPVILLSLPLFWLLMLFKPCLDALHETPFVTPSAHCAYV
jgi:hypothetical protein